MESADGTSALQVGGPVQLRETLLLPADPEEGPQPEAELGPRVQTVRVLLMGHSLSPALGYTLQLAVAPNDYRDGAPSPIFDAFLHLRLGERAHLRVGQQFVQFDRARTIREFALQLPDRQRSVAELNLDRDIGATLFLDELGGDDAPLSLKLGVFGGGGSNLIETKEPGALLVARVELRPLGPFDDDSEGDLARSPTPKLALGLAAARDQNTNRARSTHGPTFAAGTVDTSHYDADLVFKWRGFSLLAEGIARLADEDVQQVNDEEGAPLTLTARSGVGAFAQPAMMLSARLELAGRYGRLWARETADPALWPRPRRWGTRPASASTGTETATASRCRAAGQRALGTRPPASAPPSTAPWPWSTSASERRGGAQSGLQLTITTGS